MAKRSIFDLQTKPPFFLQRRMARGLTVVFGLAGWLFGRAEVAPIHGLYPYQFTWVFVFAMGLAAWACYVTIRADDAPIPSAPARQAVQGMALALLMATFAAIASSGLELSAATLAAIMLLTLAATAVAAWMAPQKRRVAWVSSISLTTTTILLVAVAGMLGWAETLDPRPFRAGRGQRRQRRGPIS